MVTSRSAGITTSRARSRRAYRFPKRQVRLAKTIEGTRGISLQAAMRAKAEIAPDFRQPSSRRQGRFCRNRLTGHALCANMSETSSSSTITVGRGKKSHFDKHEQERSEERRVAKERRSRWS